MTEETKYLDLSGDSALSIGYNGYVYAVSDTLRRWFFIIVGTIAIGVGIIGVLIPVLPTTPFLLLGAICYTRGSQRLHNALLSNRLMGSYVKNYLEGMGMSLKTKMWTLGFLWVSIASTAILATDSLIIRSILAVVLIGVTIHVLSLKPRR
ncbi:MAG: YbaN family protein [Dehalococcoidia bacterium]|nr:YbaN family protein [Dehalococcoidia bacterium]